MNDQITFPWNDRKGHLSALKLAVFAACFVPGLWIGYKLGMGQMGPKPITAALHETGSWALRFLLVTLSITPFRLITGQNRLILVRRMLGLTALSYAVIHFALFIVDQKYDLVRVASEIVLRFYLTIGFISLVALIALGVTSTDRSIRAMGALSWNKLHRLIYPLTVLALFHAFLQAKIDVSEEVVLTGIFLALMGVRALNARAVRHWVSLRPLVLFMLAVLAALMAILIEFAWYALATGLPATRLFFANFDLDLAPRPGLIVLAIALTMPIAAIVFSSASRQGHAKPNISQI